MERPLMNHLMKRHIGLALAMVALVLAGCTDDPEPKVDDPDAVLNDPDSYYADHYCVKNDVTPRELAPDANGNPWVIGDWWTYSLKVNGENLGNTKLTYYADQDFQDGVPKHYMVGTPTREEALHHALYGENPVIGRVHRILYSPHESGAHADMFNFPLCSGNSWTTHFYGTPFTFTVTESGGVYTMRGTAPDGSTAMHTFDPETKWFTRIQVNRADGFTVDMQLQDTGSGGSGPAYFLRGQKDEVVDVASIGNGFTIDRAPGGDGPYDTIGAALDFERSGTNRVELHLQNPAGESVACVGYDGSGLAGGGETSCAEPGSIFEVDFVDGNWKLVVVQAGIGNSQVSGEARIVSIYDRSVA